jgi:hypothetical protein
MSAAGDGKARQELINPGDHHALHMDLAVKRATA